MSDEVDKKLAYLAESLARTQGELLATQAAVRALILKHDDVDAAIQAVALQIERVIAAGLPKAIDEPFLEGLQRAKGRVLPSRRDIDELGSE
jgi:hypothetical protein